MAIDRWGNWDGKVESGGTVLQGSGTAVTAAPIQGSSPTIQAPYTGTGDQRLGVSPTPTYSAPAPAGPTPAQIEAARIRDIEAAEAARVEQERLARIARANALKSGITGIIGNIKGVYDAIYGDVDNAAREQTRGLTERNTNETKTLTNEFAGEFPKIGNAYAARGTYDSSYRGDAENVAKTGFNDQLETVGIGFRQDLAKVGQYVAGQRADINAQRGGLDAIMAQIQESEDPDQLQALRNQLDERQRTLEASRSGMRSQASYLQELNGVAPVTDRIASLTGSLQNVVRSQIPGALKRSIGTQLINNAGLPPEQANALISQLATQIATTDDEERV